VRAARAAARSETRPRAGPARDAGTAEEVAPTALAATLLAARTTVAARSWEGEDKKRAAHAARRRSGGDRTGGS
jgi:hypothetical protein